MPPNRSSTTGAGWGRLTTYCAKAMASGNAPLPSFPRKSRAWLSRFCSTISARCCLVDCNPITSLNSIGRNYWDGAKNKQRNRRFRKLVANKKAQVKPALRKFLRVTLWLCASVLKQCLCSSVPEKRAFFNTEVQRRAVTQRNRDERLL